MPTSSSRVSSSGAVDASVACSLSSLPVSRNYRARNTFSISAIRNGHYNSRLIISADKVYSGAIAKLREMRANIFLDTVRPQNVAINCSIFYRFLVCGYRMF